MSEMTLQLRDDILALVDAVQAKKNLDGERWSDSRASKLCLNDGDFVGKIRRWDGSNSSPTLTTVLKFEAFLRNELGPKDLEKFLRKRSRRAAPQNGTPAPGGGQPPAGDDDEW